MLMKSVLYYIKLFADMLSFTSSQKYYFYASPMDMRKDIDSLSDVVRTQMKIDPFLEGNVYIFLSKDLRKMKIL